MSALIGAMLGAAVGLGVFCGTAGWVGLTGRPNPLFLWRPTKTRATSCTNTRRVLLPHIAIGLLGFVSTLTITGWPVAAIVVALLGVGIPKLRAAKAQRTAEVERISALATWVEMVRDTIGAASGLTEALVATAGSAPVAIRREVQNLAARAERESLNDAFIKFAEEMNHAITDTIALTLGKATGNQVGSLQEALSDLAQNTRQEVSMRLKIEASRARQHASARFVMGVVATFCVGLVTFSRSYLEPFDNLSGQIALGVIGVLFIGSGLALEKMSRFKALPRILALR